jgi:hypothetical protein
MVKQLGRLTNHWPSYLLELEGGKARRQVHDLSEIESSNVTQQQHTFRARLFEYKGGMELCQLDSLKFHRISHRILRILRRRIGRSTGELHWIGCVVCSASFGRAGPK